jgi:hypothetical protein
MAPPNRRVVQRQESGALASLSPTAALRVLSWLPRRSAVIDRAGIHEDEVWVPERRWLVESIRSPCVAESVGSKSAFQRVGGEPAR